MPLIPILHDAPNDRTKRLRRWMAFATTAFTSFLILSFLWPLSVTNFRSLTVINASTHPALVDDTALEVLVSSVKLESTPERIDTLISQTAETTPIRSDAFEYRDFEAITKAIHVGVERHQDGTTKFVLSYDGAGLSDEQQFLALLTQRIGKRLTSASLSAEGQIVTTLPAEKLDRAVWIANQIERDLEEVANRVQNGSSSFHLASSNQAGDPPSRLAASIKSIETNSLKTILSDLRGNTENGKASPLISIHQMSDVSTDAVGSSPGWYASIALILISMGVATVISMNFDPAGERGFESIDNLAQQIGLPIVATLPESEDHQKITQRRWANQVVEISTLTLLALLIVVIGFMLIDTTVRESFFYHPYDGLARIVRIFAGY